jgi:hypothetical protein
MSPLRSFVYADTNLDVFVPVPVLFVKVVFFTAVGTVTDTDYTGTVTFITAMSYPVGSETSRCFLLLTVPDTGTSTCTGTCTLCV